MKLKFAILSVIIIAVLLGQINVPLFIHICSKLHTVSFLSSCGMHESIPKKHSCCEKEDSENDAGELNSGSQNQADHCVVLFSKEHSTDGSVPNLNSADAGLDLQGVIPPERIGNPHPAFLHHTFFDTSPTASPPLYLLDSSLLI